MCNVGEIVIYLRVIYCTFLVNSNKKSTKRKATKGEGLTDKKAAEPHFRPLATSSPFGNPHLSALRTTKLILVVKSHFCPRHGIGFASQICLVQEIIFGASVGQNNMFCLQKYVQTKVR